MAVRYRHNSYSFTDLLIFGITLLSVKLYTLFIPYGGARLAVLMAEAIVIVFLIVHFVYDRSPRVHMNYRWEIGLIFFSLILSTFAAFLFHGQNYKSTLLSQYDFYFFLFYFLLHFLKPNPSKLLTIFLVFGYLYALVYFAQYFVYPRLILSSKVMIDRGTIRIFMPGLPYLFTSYFILLGRFFMNKNIKYIIALIPLLIIVFLIGSRQLLASVILLTMINILLSRTIRSKLFTYLLIGACIIPVFFIFESVFSELLKVSEQQLTAGTRENIRYQAAYYFITKFNDNPLWMLVGNGSPDTESGYGRQLAMLSDQFGYYQADIGIIGDFVKFGILFVIGQFALLIKLLRTKLIEEHTFIIYNVLSIFLTMFLGAGLHSSTIGLLCFMMYIADVNKDYRKKAELSATSQ